jgi:hypothetical protein
VAAGLALRLEGVENRGAVVALDVEAQCVFYAEVADFEFTERRRAEIRLGRRYHLRVVQRLEHVEIYLDEVLQLAFCRYRGMQGELGLFVDRAEAVFTRVRGRELGVERPG